MTTPACWTVTYRPDHVIRASARPEDRRGNAGYEEYLEYQRPYSERQRQNPRRSLRRPGAGLSRGPPGGYQMGREDGSYGRWVGLSVLAGSRSTTGSSTSSIALRSPSPSR